MNAVDENYTHNARKVDQSDSEIIWYNSFYVINEYLWLYGVPILSVITIFNNVTILVVAICSSEFRKAIQKNVTIYYVAFAVTDLIILLSYHVTEWKSKFEHLLLLPQFMN